MMKSTNTPTVDELIHCADMMTRLKPHQKVCGYISVSLWVNSDDERLITLQKKLKKAGLSYSFAPPVNGTQHMTIEGETLSPDTFACLVHKFASWLAAQVALRRKFL